MLSLYIISFHEWKHLTGSNRESNTDWLSVRPAIKSYPKVLKYWDTWSHQFSVCLKWKINGFFRRPSIQAHSNEAVIYQNWGTPKNNEFSIWNKWKIYYFQVSQYLSTLGYISSECVVGCNYASPQFSSQWPGYKWIGILYVMFSRRFTVILSNGRCHFEQKYCFNQGF